MISKCQLTSVSFDVTICTFILFQSKARKVEVLHYLNRIFLFPLIYQIIFGPSIWEKKVKRKINKYCTLIILSLCEWFQESCYCSSNEASPHYGQNTTNTTNLMSWPYRNCIVSVGVCISPYRVSHLVANLSWVELNLRSSLGRLGNTVGSYYPGKMVEHPKSMLTLTVNPAVE